MRVVCGVLALAFLLVWAPAAARSSAAAPTASRLSASPPYEVGLASWYGAAFQGRETTSGEPFNMMRLTAAHPVLPLGTRVRVTNLCNDRSLVLRINDRGPVVKGRIIDVSYAAARALGFSAAGLAPVRLDVVYPR